MVGTLKSIREVSGLDLTHIPYSDGACYNPSLATLAGNEFELRQTLGAYDYDLYLNGERVGKAKREWLKDIRVKTPFEVDDKVWVSDGGNWLPRHFAKSSDEGVFVWETGKTSHTTEEMIFWKEVKSDKEFKAPNKQSVPCEHEMEVVERYVCVKCGGTATFN